MKEGTRDYNDRPPRSLALAGATLLIAACAGTAPAPEAPPDAAAGAPPPVPPPVEERREVRFETQRVQSTARYVVQPGDTLWGISERFLFDPWKWPEVWVANREVRNPHLIFPGDVLELRWLEGETRVQRIEALSPRIREHSLDEAIPTIPLELIRDFLRGPRIVDARTLETAPYVVEFDREHLIAPDRVGIYARALPDNGEQHWLVVRPGDAYVDPDTGRVLGYEAIPAADAELHRRHQEVALLELSRARRETRIGDRLLPRPTDVLAANFFPRPPPEDIRGSIIAVVGGMTQIGQHQVVTLNRGAHHGLESGHVLDVLQAGRQVTDPYRRFGRVALPEEYAGRLMVFQVYEELAHALVMDAIRPIRVLDEVRRPE